MLKKIFLFSILSIAVQFCNAQGLQTFHSFTGTTILGDTVSFSQWAGKKLLIVNTASFCGYTPQFADLQALDSTYQTNNFAVIGFPCNDFGAQDPGEDSVINNFCTGIYGVKFQMMSKVGIALPDTAPWYKWLQWQYLNGVADAQVTWNFNKFCIDENGHWVAHYPSNILPFDTAIVNWILSPPANTSVTEQTNISQVHLFTNAAANKFELIIRVEKNTDLFIRLINTQGAIISSLHKNIFQGENKINIDAELTSGIYFVQINGANFNQCLKAIKLN